MIKNFWQNHFVRRNNGLLIVLFFAVNIIFYHSFHKISFDITQDQKFTISDSFKKRLTQIKRPIDLHFYYSDRLAEKAPQLHRYGEYIRGFLHTVSSNSNGMVSVHFINVVPFSSQEDDALALGLKPIPQADGYSLFFGLLAENHLDGIGTLPFMSPQRETLLEFDIAHLIDGLSRLKKMTIGLHSSLPLSVGKDGIKALHTKNIKPFGIYKELMNRYHLLHLSQDYKELVTSNPPRVTLLLHPRPLTKKAQNNLKYYLANGGRVVAALDPISEYPQYVAPGTHPVLRSDLGGILNEYGVTFDNKTVILDSELSLKGKDPTTGMHQDYLAWIRPTKKNFSSQDPALSYVNKLSFGTVGSFNFDIDKKQSIDFLPLITSSAKGGKISVNRLYRLKNPEEVKKYYHPEQEYILAAKLFGTFTHPDVKTPKASAMVLFGDSDFLTDRFWTYPDTASQSGRSYIPFADNGALMMNITDYLLGDMSLIQLRGRILEKRTLTFLESIRNNARSVLITQEKELMQEITQLQDKIETSKKEAKNNPELKDDIIAYHQKLLSSNNALREVHREMNHAIEQVEFLIKSINIILVPFIVGLFPTFFLLRNRKKMHKKIKDKI